MQRERGRGRGKTKKINTTYTTSRTLSPRKAAAAEEPATRRPCSCEPSSASAAVPTKRNGLIQLSADSSVLACAGCESQLLVMALSPAEDKQRNGRGRQPQPQQQQRALRRCRASSPPVPGLGLCLTPRARPIDKLAFA